MTLKIVNLVAVLVLLVNLAILVSNPVEKACTKINCSNQNVPVRTARWREFISAGEWRQWQSEPWKWKCVHLTRSRLANWTIRTPHCGTTMKIKSSLNTHYPVTIDALKFSVFANCDIFWLLDKKELSSILGFTRFQFALSIWSLMVIQRARKTQNIWLCAASVTVLWRLTQTHYKRTITRTVLLHPHRASKPNPYTRPAPIKTPLEIWPWPGALKHNDHHTCHVSFAPPLTLT